MKQTLAQRIVNMVAYGCFNKGLDRDLLEIRLRNILTTSSLRLIYENFNFGMSADEVDDVCCYTNFKLINEIE